MAPIAESTIDYVYDSTGKPKAAIVPIDIWRELESEIETHFLLDNPVMRERLLRSKESTIRIPLDEVLRQTGLSHADWINATA